MAATTKAQLEEQIKKLEKQLQTLKEGVISKSALSASKAAVNFLLENVSDIQSVDMDTGYGHVTFKLKR